MARTTKLLVLVTACTAWAASPAPDGAGGPDSHREIDAGTLRYKVLCGYQGWFRCPGDPAKQGWRHWSRNAQRIAPESLTFEMWPDMSDYARDEQYAAAGFTNPDGSPACLFSSVNPKTVQRHFTWMRDYGIDGVFLQRFVVNLKDRSQDQVLDNVRAAAKWTGRVFAVCYDLTGAPTDTVYERLVADWKQLVDGKVTHDSRYLHHNQKPVLFIWGFYSDRFGPELANRLIDYFRDDGVTLIGGCQWYWRKEKNPEWAKVFRRFDVISPWNVGNATLVAGKKQASTAYWKDDIAEAKRANMAYLPVIYPGFGWTNLKGNQAAKDTIPRLGGAYLWKQFVDAADLGIDMAYVAMFDEVDEGTAIFKVTNTPPRPGRFLTYEGLPADWYLRLTGEGTRMLRGERPKQQAIPIKS